jgi:hypothetical protein
VSSSLLSIRLLVFTTAFDNVLMRVGVLSHSQHKIRGRERKTHGTSASAFSMRRALAPRRSETKLDSLMWHSSQQTLQLVLQAHGIDTADIVKMRILQQLT